MDTSRGTEALVALEDAAPDVLFETVPGTDIQLWPLLRWPVARSMAAAELGTVAVRRSVSRSDLIKRKIRQHLPNRFASSRIGSHAEQLFIVDGGTFAPTSKGRKNWLVEDFALAVNDAVILQDLPLDGFTPRRDRPSYRRTFSFEDAAATVRDRARSTPLTTEVAASARSFVQAVYDNLDFVVDDAGRAEAERQLLIRLARVPHTLAEFDRILQRVQPSTAFVQTGSYGDRSHLIALMKSGGTHVAEHQHGWIGPSHGAYNFGAAMRSPALARSVPDTLLTFGEFWSERVRFPGATVAIGKPHLEEAAGALPPLAEREPVVMIVSSVYDRDEVTRFALQVRDLLPPEWRVTLRPHPRERATVEQLYPGLVGESRVDFDREPDVYESLGSVRGVFGLASTVLYEALALGCEVHIKQSPLADLYIEDGIFGERITDTASTERAVASVVGNSQHAGTAYVQSTLDSIWKPHAAENFKAFVTDLR